jgi:hypothetical protein
MYRKIGHLLLEGVTAVTAVARRKPIGFSRVEDVSTALYPDSVFIPLSHAIHTLEYR